MHRRKPLVFVCSGGQKPTVDPDFSRQIQIQIEACQSAIIICSRQRHTLHGKFKFKLNRTKLPLYLENGKITKQNIGCTGQVVEAEKTICSLVSRPILDLCFFSKVYVTATYEQEVVVLKKQGIVSLKQLGK
jgi:hypothetical protein